MAKTAFKITDKAKEVTGIVSDIDENTIQIEWEDENTETFTNEELEALLETDDYSIEEVVLDEEDGGNVAQNSIKAHTTATPPGVEADGNPKTRLELMLGVIGGLGQIDLQTLARLSDEVIQGGVNKSAEHATEGKVAGNQASIQMKPSLAMKEALVTLEKEEQDAIFGASTLTEDAKGKMSLLFETAVSARVLAETVKIQELLEAKYDTNIKEMSDGLVDKIDQYFDHIVTEWVDENSVAIESTLRTQLTNEFIDQLKTVFVENYIDIPEDKVEILEAVVVENEDLKKQINDKINENIAKETELKALKKSLAVEKLAEGLTLVQKTNLRKLVSETEYTDEDAFTKKVTVIKESFLKTPVKESNILVEGIADEDTVENVPSDLAIARAAKLLSVR